MLRQRQPPGHCRFFLRRVPIVDQKLAPRDGRANLLEHAARRLSWLLIFHQPCRRPCRRDRKSTRLNSSHRTISYAVFCLKKKKHHTLFPFINSHLLLHSSSYFHTPFYRTSFTHL